MRVRASLGVSLFLVVLATLFAGCGGGSSYSEGSTTQSGSAGGGGAKSVTIADYTYKPATLTVPVGTTVTFTNQDSTAHTATSKTEGAFDSGSIDTGKGATITLEEAGSFAYYCQFHPFMKGTIEVE